MTGREPHPDAGPSGREWIDRFAHRLGIDPPDDATVTELLDIAGVAAHSSERIAAPLACYLIGRAGIEPLAARSIVDELATDADEPTRPSRPKTARGDPPAR